MLGHGPVLDQSAKDTTQIHSKVQVTVKQQYQCLKTTNFLILNKARLTAATQHLTRRFIHLRLKFENRTRVLQSAKRSYFKEKTNQNLAIKVYNYFAFLQIKSRVNEGIFDLT